ncbi:thiamine diphosphokinase [Brevibacillus ginsengisoli]|uniref:thiamine diphosphokinase n=1 Tax=Brevibacillus ginsengisoli TaxID=363854 RepID=UPI003CEA257E
MNQTKPIIHIATGGNLDVLPRLAEGDIVIGVDGGAIGLLEAGIVPDIALGDFDTIKEVGIKRLLEAGVAMEQFPAQKDLTDTEIALQKALELAPSAIYLYGAMGSRMDHTLANLQLLYTAHQAGVWMQLESKRNRVMLLSERFPSLKIALDDYRFMSLLPLTLEVTGIHLEGFRYPLHDATIKMGMAIGVSNELQTPTGTITIGQGSLYVMCTND